MRNEMIKAALIKAEEFCFSLLDKDDRHSINDLIRKCHNEKLYIRRNDAVRFHMNWLEERKKKMTEAKIEKNVIIAPTLHLVDNPPVLIEEQLPAASKGESAPIPQAVKMTRGEAAILAHAVLKDNRQKKKQYVSILLDKDPLMTPEKVSEEIRSHFQCKMSVSMDYIRECCTIAREGYYSRMSTKAKEIQVAETKTIPGVRVDTEKLSVEVALKHEIEKIRNILIANQFESISLHIDRTEATYTATKKVDVGGKL